MESFESDGFREGDGSVDKAVEERAALKGFDIDRRPLKEIFAERRAKKAIKAKEKGLSVKHNGEEPVVRVAVTEIKGKR